MRSPTTHSQGPGPDDAALERRCQAIGDAIAGTLPGHPDGAPEGADGPLPDRLVLAAALRPAGSRVRRLLIGIPAATAVAAVAALIAVISRPISYELEGAAIDHQERFETGADSGARMRFTDGTAILVGQRTAARIKNRTPHGATFALEHGRAALAVMHLPHADWHVEAGPFDIAVTGTDFDVRWSDDGDALEVVMRAGSTIVRGSLAGGGIPLHAGQRLVASLSRKTLVVNPIDGGHERSAPPAPPPVSAAAYPAGAARPRRERAPAGHAATRHDVAAADEAGAHPGAAPAVLPVLPAEDPVPDTLLLPPDPLPQPPAPPPAVIPPPPAPPPPPPSRLNAGGAACAEGPAPQLPFERLSEGFAATGGAASAFTSPVLDHTRSWCGGASLRFNADFNLAGTPDWQGQMPYQIGEATVILPVPIDIQRRTVTVHFYVDGPEDAEFNARILADQFGRRIGDSYAPSLYARRWWTISTTFRTPSRIFEGAASGQSNRLVLRIDAVGTRRVWAGAIYIDDISWR